LVLTLKSRAISEINWRSSPRLPYNTQQLLDLSSLLKERKEAEAADITKIFYDLISFMNSVHIND